MTQQSAPVHGRHGKPPRGGSPEAAAADRQRRREEYVRLRTRLAMAPAELAALLGLSRGTVRRFPAWTDPALAPTDAALAVMRRELVRRARVTIEEARVRREIERELVEAEAREHLADCEALYGDLGDDRSEAA